MSTRAYEDWVARRSSPEFERPYEPKPADTIDLPEVMVSEGDAAADTIRRHLAAQRRQWTQRKLA